MRVLPKLDTVLLCLLLFRLSAEEWPRRVCHQEAAGGGEACFWMEDPSAANETPSKEGETPSSSENEVSNTVCPVGSYCSSGKRMECPAGRWGGSVGLMTASCSGECPPGYQCPSGTSDPVGCGGPTSFCPAGSKKQTPTPRGYVAIKRGDGPRAGFSGVEPCKSGGWCSEGRQHYCAPGKYSASSTEVCLDCFEGHKCPLSGSVRGDVEPCGANFYCPPGSSTTGVQVQKGYYAIYNSVVAEAFGERPCPAGRYCSDALAFDCPAGRFGQKVGSDSALCDGPCAAGRYCPDAARLDPWGEECGSPDVFCPLGSTKPIEARTGFYTIGAVEEKRCEPGGWCSSGQRTLCPAGSYCSLTGAFDVTSCVESPVGNYIPTDGSTAFLKCVAPSYICPFQGMTAPQRVQIGHYSVNSTKEVVASAGHYASQGLLLKCPAGRFGDQQALSEESCSGPCSPGFYCPSSGARKNTMRECGGFEWICPGAGMVAPTRVLPGYYTASAEILYDEEAENFALLDMECPAGRYRSVFNGSTELRVRAAPCELCGAGTFKAQEGEESCVACGMEATEDRRSCLCTRASGGFDLGEEEALYYNVSTAQCDVVSKEDLLHLGSTNESVFTLRRSFECDPGHWCSSALRRGCPAGRFGESTRETSRNCSGACLEGFYCPEKSISPTAVRCGSNELYCPPGSSLPSTVQDGFYTTGGTDLTRVSQAPCPPGYYCLLGEQHPCPKGRYGLGNSSEEQCVGECATGFYCLAASSTPTQHQCGGPSLVCPRGSHAPLKVPEGYYSINAGPDGDELFAVSGSEATRDAMLPCEPGYYCTGGLKAKCGDYRFGWRYFATSPDCDGGVAPGCFMPLSDEPYFTDCPFECGDNGLFCEGGLPFTVLPGYYSVGVVGELRRTSQQPCPPGTFCLGGNVFACPAGKYQPNYAATSCDMLCPKGNYCPLNSTAPTPCPSGTFATGAAKTCTSCPGSSQSGGAKTQRCFDDRLCCQYF